MNKYLTLDYWMNKLGYRRTHWTDPIGEMFTNVYLHLGKTGKATLVIGSDLVTLSVKKMKK